MFAFKLCPFCDGARARTRTCAHTHTPNWCVQRNVDPELGTTEDWLAFVADAHSRGMKVVSDFNPSYFWTGAPAFKQATADIKEYGVNGPNLPAASPARWFRWAPDCGKESPTQPDDAHPQNGVTNGWVRSPAAGGACYYSIWGVGQPCGDLAAPAWQAELTRIIRHWIADLKLDGFMLDAPGFYLVYKGNRTDGTAANPISGLTDAVIADALHKVIVQPAHELGAAVFGETYNLGRPPINKVLDAGRSTDMPDKGEEGKAVLYNFITFSFFLSFFLSFLPYIICIYVIMHIYMHICICTHVPPGM